MTPAELDQALRAEEALARELREYAGRWVAVRDRSVVASANSLNDLLDHVDPSGLDRILEVSKDPIAACLY